MNTIQIADQENWKLTRNVGILEPTNPNAPLLLSLTVRNGKQICHTLQIVVYEAGVLIPEEG